MFFVIFKLSKWCEVIFFKSLLLLWTPIDITNTISFFCYKIENPVEPQSKKARSSNETEVTTDWKSDINSASNYSPKNLSADEKLLAETALEKGLDEYDERGLFLRTRFLQRHYTDRSVAEQIEIFPWLKKVSEPDWCNNMSLRKYSLSLKRWREYNPAPN